MFHATSRLGLIFFLACLYIFSVEALTSDGRLHANAQKIAVLPLVEVDTTEPVTSRTGVTLPPYNTTYYFDQLIDHNDPLKGTFKQRYWFTYEFYLNGGPIILMTPGEANAAGATGYLTNKTINGLIAQQENGAVVIIEHRFYGLSNPFPDLSVQSLRVHTIQQAIDDLDYFARNVVLPMPGGNSVSPPSTPWILTGGSYAGALTAWTRVNKPDTFWIGYSSSGVVQTIIDFWRYFEPIYQYMPSNCSSDVQTVIAYIDEVFTGNNQTTNNYVKSVFGLSELSHLDDVAGTLRNPLWEWQSMQPFIGPNATFYQFCDALEVKNGVSAPATGWGLENALNAWGAFFTGGYLANLCSGYSNLETCLGTYDPNLSMWTNTTIDNAWRSWFWIVCNEVGWLQEGAPYGQPTLVTRLVQPIYDERQCTYMFADAFAVPPTPNVYATNSAYNGWNVKLDRQFFANGHRDPWREATVSAETQNISGTATQPIDIGDGFHCSDLITRSGFVDPTIAQVQKDALGYVATWMAEWHALNSTVTLY